MSNILKTPLLGAATNALALELYARYAIMNTYVKFVITKTKIMNSSSWKFAVITVTAHIKRCQRNALNVQSFSVMHIARNVTGHLTMIISLAHNNTYAQTRISPALSVRNLFIIRSIHH